MNPDPSRSPSPRHNAGASSGGAAGKSRKGSGRSRRGSAPRRLIDTTGPDPAARVEDVRLTIGVINGTHGLDGEVRMTILTDTPDHLYDLSSVYLGDDAHPSRIENVRFHGDVALISLEGVDTVEKARELRGKAVRISGADARPLEEGEYFIFQLIGLNALTQEGEQLGVVVDLIETGAHDVLIIAPKGTAASRSPADEILVPNQESFVHDIDPVAGTIIVSKPVYSHEVKPS